jgi:hypothetical protein
MFHTVSRFLVGLPPILLTAVSPRICSCHLHRHSCITNSAIIGWASISIGTDSSGPIEGKVDRGMRSGTVGIGGCNLAFEG